MRCLCSLYRRRNAAGPAARLFKIGLRLLLLFPGLAGLAGSQVVANTGNGDQLSQSPRSWAEAGAANQGRILEAGSDVPLRFRERKTNARGDTTREVVESREGSVARLVQRNGAPLTVTENNEERERLNGILSSPETFLSRHRRDHAGREYALELVHALPGAMLWSYAPGQPQLADGAAKQVVLDFTPDPKFRPPTLIAEALSGIAGRVWLDAQTRCVTRIEGHILHPIDFGWGGMLARVREGGIVELEQTQVTQNRWFYSHLSEHVTLREMLVHTVTEDSTDNASEAHVLPAPVSFQQAVRDLLAMPVSTR